MALARALAPRPAVLLADEPTGNLDESTGQHIIDLLFASHRRRGGTLLLVTHDRRMLDTVRVTRRWSMTAGRLTES